MWKANKINPPQRSHRTNPTRHRWAQRTQAACPVVHPQWRKPQCYLNRIFCELWCSSPQPQGFGPSHFWMLSLRCQFKFISIALILTSCKRTSLGEMLETHRVSLLLGNVDLVREKLVEIHLYTFIPAKLLLICFSKPDSFLTAWTCFFKSPDITYQRAISVIPNHQIKTAI